MKEYKTCEDCGGTGRGKKMFDLDRYHQCPKCAGRGKYYDITSVTAMMPAYLMEKHAEMMDSFK